MDSITSPFFSLILTPDRRLDPFFTWRKAIRCHCFRSDNLESASSCFFVVSIITVRKINHCLCRILCISISIVIFVIIVFTVMIRNIIANLLWYLIVDNIILLLLISTFAIGSFLNYQYRYTFFVSSFHIFMFIYWQRLAKFHIILCKFDILPSNFK